MGQNGRDLPRNTGRRSRSKTGGSPGGSVPTPCLPGSMPARRTSRGGACRCGPSREQRSQRLRGLQNLRGADLNPAPSRASHFASVTKRRRASATSGGGEGWPWCPCPFQVTHPGDLGHGPLSHRRPWWSCARSWPCSGCTPAPGNRVCTHGFSDLSSGVCPSPCPPIPLPPCTHSASGPTHRPRPSHSACS